MKRANFPLILVGSEDHPPWETALLTQLFNFAVYFYRPSWPFAINHKSRNSTVKDRDAPHPHRQPQDFSLWSGSCWWCWRGKAHAQTSPERLKHPFTHKYPPPYTLLPQKHSLALRSEVNLAYKAAGAVKSLLHSVYLMFGEILAVLILPGQ